MLAAALGYIAVVDPHRQDSVFPACPFRLLTGWNCPACGGLRMTHDLLHGDLVAAVRDNVFLLVAMPLLAASVLLCRRRVAAHPKLVVAAVVVSAFAWTVLRNVPGFPLEPTWLTG